MIAERPLKFASPLIDEATIAGVGDVLRSGHITSGPWVERFEAALSAFCGGRPVRVLTSATAAIEVALQLADIGPGDEVITCGQSFFTVLNMIVKQRATPVFVDCDLVTRNIELGRVAARIGPRTRAIMPTHWPGSLVDISLMPPAFHVAITFAGACDRNSNSADLYSASPTKSAFAALYT